MRVRLEESAVGLTADYLSGERRLTDPLVQAGWRGLKTLPYARRSFQRRGYDPDARRCRQLTVTVIARESRR